MKKTIATGLLGVLLLFPGVSSAQTIDQSALDTLKAQLIELLMAQVAVLQAQLVALQADQDDLRATVEADSQELGGVEEEVVEPEPEVVEEDVVYPDNAVVIDVNEGGVVVKSNPLKNSSRSSNKSWDVLEIRYYVSDLDDRAVEFRPRFSITSDDFSQDELTVDVLIPWATGNISSTIYGSNDKWYSTGDKNAFKVVYRVISPTDKTGSFQLTAGALDARGKYDSSSDIQTPSASTYSFVVE